MKAVDSHLEGVKPLFDMISVGVVDPTAQSQSKEGSPVPKLIDQKHRVFAVVFLSDPIKEYSRRVSSKSFKQLYIEEQLCVKVYCSVQPRPFAVDFDSGLVDRDPLRLRRRRVRYAVGQSVNPLEDRLKRAIYADRAESPLFSERDTGSVEPDGERPDGRPQNASRSGVRTRREASR